MEFGLAPGAGAESLAQFRICSEPEHSIRKHPVVIGWDDEAANPIAHELLHIST